MNRNELVCSRSSSRDLIELIVCVCFFLAWGYGAFRSKRKMSKVRTPEPIDFFIWTVEVCFRTCHCMSFVSHLFPDLMIWNKVRIFCFRLIKKWFFPPSVWTCAVMHLDRMNAIDLSTKRFFPFCWLVDFFRSQSMLNSLSHFLRNCKILLNSYSWFEFRPLFFALSTILPIVCSKANWTDWS